MVPWVLLGTAPMPGDTTELRLLQRGDEFSLRLGRDELMNSRSHGSEDALATMALDRMRGRAQPRLLIGGAGMGFTLRAGADAGGLGVGFTLRAAFDAIGRAPRIVVAEVSPEVVAWNRGPLAPVSGHSLEDP